MFETRCLLHGEGNTLSNDFFIFYFVRDAIFPNVRLLTLARCWVVPSSKRFAGKSRVSIFALATTSDWWPRELVEGQELATLVLMIVVKRPVMVRHEYRPTLYIVKVQCHYQPSSSKYSRDGPGTTANRKSSNTEPQHITY